MQCRRQESKMHPPIGVLTEHTSCRLLRTYQVSANFDDFLMVDVGLDEYRHLSH